MDKGIEIIDRFLAAYRELRDVRGMSQAEFCAKVGADRRNFYTLLKNPARRLVKNEWLAGIVSSYGVSAHWLLTGQGTMFGV
jgi:hypothetical protein